MLPLGLCCFCTMWNLGVEGSGHTLHTVGQGSAASSPARWFGSTFPVRLSQPNPRPSIMAGEVPKHPEAKAADWWHKMARIVRILKRQVFYSVLLPNINTIKIDCFGAKLFTIYMAPAVSAALHERVHSNNIIGLFWCFYGKTSWIPRLVNHPLCAAPAGFRFWSRHGADFGLLAPGPHYFSVKIKHGTRRNSL